MSSIVDSDARLLARLQQSIAVEARPFRRLGHELEMSEDEVIARTVALKQSGVIRQISAIFDTRSLGYASTLVATRVPEDRLDAAAAEIGRHPGVTHNYRRDHDFNLWYTLTVSPESRLGLESTVDLMHRRSGAESTRILPTLKLFKIGVHFAVAGRGTGGAAPAYTELNRRPMKPLSEMEKAFVLWMQRDLPLVPEPFVAAARGLGIGLEALAAMHRDFLKTGRMRRLAAVLRHRKAGYAANAMGVWAHPSEDPRELAAAGRCMAGFDAVSHCYLRPSYPDWPYQLFTMVHGETREACEQTLATIAAETGIERRASLYSTHEYKKTRAVYFTDAEAQWEEAEGVG